MLIATFAQNKELTVQDIAEAQVEDRSGIRFVVTDLEATHKEISQRGAAAMSELGRDMEMVVALPWEMAKRLIEAAGKNSEEEVEELKKELTKTKSALTKAINKLEATEADLEELKKSLEGAKEAKKEAK